MNLKEQKILASIKNAPIGILQRVDLKIIEQSTGIPIYEAREILSSFVSKGILNEYGEMSFDNADIIMSIEGKRIAQNL